MERSTQTEESQEWQAKFLSLLLTSRHTKWVIPVTVHCPGKEIQNAEFKGAWPRQSKPGHSSEHTLLLCPSYVVAHTSATPPPWPHQALQD